MRTVSRLVLVFATTLLLAACAVDAGRVAGVDGANASATPYAGFH